MPLATRNRSDLGTAFVLMLAACVFAFAIYIKASPPSDNPITGSSPTHVKFWVKTAASLNSKVKMATVDDFVVSPPAVLSLVHHSGSSKALAPAVIRPLKDLFAESGYWFRPPPHS